MSCMKCKIWDAESTHQQPVVPVAGEVVALAVVPGDLLLRVLPWGACALPAHALAPVVAEDGGGVVRAAPRLKVVVELEVVHVALACRPEEVGVALADAALVRAVKVALRGPRDVRLGK